MTAAFDPRIVKVSIELEDGVHTFQDLQISARGTRYGSGIMNDCEVKIYNLKKETRNFILTQTSPFRLNDRKPIRMKLEVGRESYGTFILYEGNVIAGTPTQPPDIGIVLKSLTNSWFMGNLIASNHVPIASLKAISQKIADENSLTLDWHATDKNIENYSFSGASLKQVDKLNRMGGVLAFVDNDKLVVVDDDKGIPGAPRLINMSTGMIGIPEVDERGLRVKVLMDNSLRLSGAVKVESKINPSANGTFSIQKLDFEVANRENQFWYIAECTRLIKDYVSGGQ